MLTNDNKNQLILIRQLILPVILAMITGMLILRYSPLFFIAIFFGAIAILLFLISPHIIITLLLISRSGLDIFTDVGFHIGPMMLNIPSITSLFILVGGGLYLFIQISVKKILVLDKIGKIFLFWLTTLLFWAFLSYSYFGSKGLIGLREWIRLSSLFMIYALVFKLTMEFGYKRVINIIFWALPVPLIAGFYQIMTSGGIKVGGMQRIYGTLAHSSSFSVFLVLFIGLTLWKIRFTKKRFAWAALLITELFLLINTFSIGGIIMLFVMSLIIFVKILRMQYRFIILFSLIFVFIYFAFSPYGQQRLNEVSRTGDIVKAMRTGKMLGEGSMAWRIVNWHLFLKEWVHKPLLGYGLATAGNIISPMKNMPHNDYLRFLVETGVAGLFLFLFLIFSLGKEIISLYRFILKLDVEFSELVLISFSIYAAWLVGSFSDNYITATGFQYYFWSLMGALFGSRKKYLGI